MSPSGIPAAGMAVSTGTGSCRHDDTLARRPSSGTAGPFSSGVMNPAGR
jgi:hypothetical protein